METGVGEARGDAAKLERLEQERPPHRLPVRTEVAALTVSARLEPQCLVLRTTVRELGGNQVTGAHATVRTHLAFEREPVLVAPPNLSREVDLPLEYLVQMMDELSAVADRHPVESIALYYRVPEHILDFSGRVDRIGPGRRLDHRRAPTCFVPGQAHGRIRIQHDVDAPEPPVSPAKPERDLGADLHPPWGRLLLERHQEHMMLS